MSEIAPRWRKVAAAFTDRARNVPDGAWDNPAPCEGWVARDVIAHLVEWMPGMILEGSGLPVPNIPDVQADPLGAWTTVDTAFQAALDDPESAARELDMQVGRYRVDDAVATFCLGDVLIHTWDLARATGQDETLDADEVHGMFEGMLPMDAVLRDSGHFGPKVDVPDDADEQTRLIAFTGRQP